MFVLYVIVLANDLWYVFLLFSQLSFNLPLQAVPATQTSYLLIFCIFFSLSFHCDLHPNCILSYCRMVL